MKIRYHAQKWHVIRTYNASRDEPQPQSFIEEGWEVPPCLYQQAAFSFLIGFSFRTDICQVVINTIAPII